MMNILEKEDLIKGLPDNVLQQQMQAPTGELPQYLLISEIQRRTDMRKSLQEQPKQESVADQIRMEGIMATRPQMPPQMQPPMGMEQPPMPMEQPPMGMAQGGVVKMRNLGKVPSRSFELAKKAFQAGATVRDVASLLRMSVNDVMSTFGSIIPETALSPPEGYTESQEMVNVPYGQEFAQPALDFLRPDLSGVEIPSPFDVARSVKGAAGDYLRNVASMEEAKGYEAAMSAPDRDAASRPSRGDVVMGSFPETSSERGILTNGMPVFQETSIQDDGIRSLIESPRRLLSEAEMPKNYRNPLVEGPGNFMMGEFNTIYQPSGFQGAGSQVTGADDEAVSADKKSSSGIDFSGFLPNLQRKFREGDEAIDRAYAESEGINALIDAGAETARKYGIGLPVGLAQDVIESGVDLGALGLGAIDAATQVPGRFLERFMTGQSGDSDKFDQESAFDYIGKFRPFSGVESEVKPQVVGSVESGLSPEERRKLALRETEFYNQALRKLNQKAGSEAQVAGVDDETVQSLPQSLDINDRTEADKVIDVDTDVATDTGTADVSGGIASTGSGTPSVTDSGGLIERILGYVDKPSKAISYADLIEQSRSRAKGEALTQLGLGIMGGSLQKGLSGASKAVSAARDAESKLSLQERIAQRDALDKDKSRDIQALGAAARIQQASEAAAARLDQYEKALKRERIKQGALNARNVNDMARQMSEEAVKQITDSTIQKIPEGFKSIEDYRLYVFNFYRDKFLSEMPSLDDEELSADLPGVSGRQSMKMINRTN